MVEALDDSATRIGLDAARIREIAGAYATSLLEKIDIPPTLIRDAASRYGISYIHAHWLLTNGCNQNILSDPGNFIGSAVSGRILGFWRHIEDLTVTDWFLCSPTLRSARIGRSRQTSSLLDNIGNQAPAWSLPHHRDTATKVTQLGCFSYLGQIEQSPGNITLLANYVAQAVLEIHCYSLASLFPTYPYLNALGIKSPREIRPSPI